MWKVAWKTRSKLKRHAENVDCGDGVGDGMDGTVLCVSNRKVYHGGWDGWSHMKNRSQGWIMTAIELPFSLLPVAMERARSRRLRLLIDRDMYSIRKVKVRSRNTQRMMDGPDELRTRKWGKQNSRNPSEREKASPLLHLFSSVWFPLTHTTGQSTNIETIDKKQPASTT